MIKKISNGDKGFEDTKGVIRIRKSKNRENNGQKKKKTHQSEKQQRLALVTIDM
jgi:hypothetical protein